MILRGLVKRFGPISFVLWLSGQYLTDIGAFLIYE